MPDGVARDQLEQCIASQGWQAVPTSRDELASLGREPWNVVVIGARQVTGDTLLLCAEASRYSQTCTLVIAEDRDPLHIADVLRAGADDYLAAPYADEECAARLQSLILHAQHLAGRQRRGQVAFDFASRTVGDGTTVVALSAREWDVLVALLEADDQPLTGAELSTTLWGADSHQSTLATTISRLRRKLHDHGLSAFDIQTVRGQGYVARFRRA
jgi:DNA-binding response OmpR family regulator